MVHGEWAVDVRDEKVPSLCVSMLLLSMELGSGANSFTFRQDLGVDPNNPGCLHTRSIICKCIAAVSRSHGIQSRAGCKTSNFRVWRTPFEVD